jgi:predicted nucleic acid-binding protein
MPRTPAEAVSAIADILSLPGIHLLPVPVEAVSRWIALAQQRPVTGGRIFDLQIAATMQANGVNRIYTYNTGDFETFSGLTVTDPREAMA